MRPRTLRGLYVCQGFAWVILRRAADGSRWYPLEHTVRTRRADSIAEVGRPWYRQARRRGDVRAVRVTLEPMPGGLPHGK